MFKAKIIKRKKSWDYNEWVYDEEFEDFVNRVMEEANKIKNVSIQFTENYAVIIYTED